MLTPLLHRHNIMHSLNKHADHARAHITGPLKRYGDYALEYHSLETQGPLLAGSRRLCTERKGFGVCGCVSTLPENLPLMDTEVQFFLCPGYSWLAPTLDSPPHPFLSCLFKPNDLYHFLGRAQGKRWKLGSRSMNINKTFYTPSKGQARHVPHPLSSPLSCLLFTHFHTVFHPSCDITPSSVNEKNELYSTLTL